MPEIESSVQAVGAIVRTLSVSVPSERVAAEFDSAYERLRARTQLPGFRRGRVPRHLLEQRYGDEVHRDVLTSLIETACAVALRKHELDAVAAPRLLSHTYEKGSPLTFEARVELRPRIELGRYRELELERKIVRVDDGRVGEACEGLRQRFAVLHAVEDRVDVRAGDVVVFDMYGFSDGEPVRGTSREGLQLELGSGRFPAEFERQLVGVTRSIRTPISVDFPADHADANLAGKTVRFDVTVREIKEKVLPTLDDEFAKELGIEGCESMDALKEHVRRDLERRERLEADRRLRQDMLDALVDAHEFEVPETIVHETIHGYLHELGVGHAPEEKLQQLHDALRPRAVRQVKAGFLLDSIARAEGMEATDEEFRKRVARQLAAAGAEAENVRRHYAQPAPQAELRQAIMREKTVEKIIELASIRDSEIEESQVADQR